MKISQLLAKLPSGQSYGWLSAATRIPIRSAVRLRYMFDDVTYSENEVAEEIIPKEHAFKHMSFTFAAISLSALVARADGTVSKEEYLIFRDSFPLADGMCGKIRKLFLLACQSKTPPEIYVQQIKHLFPNQKDLFISLVDRLFRIATADKPLTGKETKILAKISHLLGLTPAEYSALHEKYSKPLPAHLVLGVKKHSTQNIIKQKYHKLMNKYHPDHYCPSTTSPEVQMLLTLKSSEISQAYKALRYAS